MKHLKVLNNVSDVNSLQLGDGRKDWHQIFQFLEWPY
jgi:hypothetical protein